MQLSLLKLPSNSKIVGLVHPLQQTTEIIIHVYSLVNTQGHFVRSLCISSSQRGSLISSPCHLHPKNGLQMKVDKDQKYQDQLYIFVINSMLQ